MPSKYTEYLKCDFTDQEIADAAKELARANYKRTSLEQRKKEVDSAIKGEIESENTTIQRLSTWINNGYEYRDVECRVELDTPEQGRKRVVRLDTGEEVKVVVMTDGDKQMALDLEAQSSAEQQDSVQTMAAAYNMPGAPQLAIEGDVVISGSV